MPNTLRGAGLIADLIDFHHSSDFDRERSVWCSKIEVGWFGTATPMLRCGTKLTKQGSKDVACMTLVNANQGAPPSNVMALTGGPAVQTRWRQSGNAHPPKPESCPTAYGFGSARASAAGRAGQSNASLAGRKLRWLTENRAGAKVKSGSDPESKYRGLEISPRGVRTPGFLSQQILLAGAPSPLGRCPSPLERDGAWSG